eukprot:jgi/Tetstr1/434568/TSEL_023659.t1
MPTSATPIPAVTCTRAVPRCLAPRLPVPPHNAPRRPIAVRASAAAGDVEVRTSGISGAGLGVFALGDFEPNVPMTQYAGEAEPPEAPPPGGLITMDMLAERCLARAREYSLELDNGRTLVGATDASDPVRVGHMVNDAGCILAETSLETGAPAALEAYIGAISSGCVRPANASGPSPPPATIIN